MNRRVTTDVWIERAKAKHGNRYDYSRAVCAGMDKTIDIICPEHGLFTKRAGKHLEGQGCPSCSVGGTHARWSIQENEFLKEHYKARGASWCSEQLKRHRCGVISHASLLGLTRPIAARLDHDHVPGFFWANLCSNAKVRDLSVEITPDDIWAQFERQKGRCALTGWSIQIGDRASTTASVDRIDSSMGYIKTNIQMVHKLVNRAKWDVADRRFYEMCKAVAGHRKEDLDTPEPHRQWMEWDILNDTERVRFSGKMTRQIEA